MAYWVLHVDLDQFIAAVEVLRRPELAGQPVVVGGTGDPTLRGVVATASYAAREFGVRSGMPLRTALKRCPDAVFLAVDKPAYEEASEQVMAVLRGFPDAIVEVMGWDEAFVGAVVDDPLVLARAIQAAVLDETRLACSIGIGDNLLRAKIATDFGKPAGTYTLTMQNWDTVMGDRPTEALFGIGAKTARKLAVLGLHTVRELGAADRETLAAVLGPTRGPYYVQLGRGIGRAVVEGTPWVPRSHGREVTFQANLESWDEVEREVASLAQLVAGDLRASGRLAVRVEVKVRFAPFSTYTRSVALSSPSFDTSVIASGAADALGRFRTDRAVRLLGVRASFRS